MNKSTHKQQALPRNPDMAVRALLEIIAELQSVYEQETQILKTSDTKGFVALQDHKLEIAHRYQCGVQELLVRKAELKNVSPALKQRLTDAQAQFSEMAGQNLNALSRMHRGVERLGQRIRDKAKEAVQKQQVCNYSASGEIARNERKLISTGITETA